MAKQAKATLEVENLDAVADRGYFSSEQIQACEKAGITVTLPKPMTPHSKAEGRFGKQDFRYLVAEDVYVTAGDTRLRGRHEGAEAGLHPPSLPRSRNAALRAADGKVRISPTAMLCFCTHWTRGLRRLT